jgi:hypothetical protein
MGNGAARRPPRSSTSHDGPLSVSRSSISSSLVLQEGTTPRNDEGAIQAEAPSASNGAEVLGESESHAKGHEALEVLQNEVVPAVDTCRAMIGQTWKSS